MTASRLVRQRKPKKVARPKKSAPASRADATREPPVSAVTQCTKPLSATSQTPLSRTASRRPQPFAPVRLADRFGHGRRESAYRPKRVPRAVARSVRRLLLRPGDDGEVDHRGR